MMRRNVHGSRRKVGEYPSVQVQKGDGDAGRDQKGLAKGEGVWTFHLALVANKKSTTILTRLETKG